MTITTLYLTLLLVGLGHTLPTNGTDVMRSTSPGWNYNTTEPTNGTDVMRSTSSGWYDYTTPTSDGETETEYQCAYSDITIPSYWQCDGEKDCLYGDDEEDCGEGSPTPSTHRYYTSTATEYPTFIPDETIDYYFHLISNYLWGFYVQLIGMY